MFLQHSLPLSTAAGKSIIVDDADDRSVGCDLEACWLLVVGLRCCLLAYWIVYIFCLFAYYVVKFSCVCCFLDCMWLAGRLDGLLHRLCVCVAAHWMVGWCVGVCGVQACWLVMLLACCELAC